MIQGLWGFELVPDMTCAENPVQIDLTTGPDRLVFSWPKSVTYSDGSVSDSVTFRIQSVEGLVLSLRREGDGVSATISVAPDGASFQYVEKDPNSGSRFDRCEGISS